MSGLKKKIRSCPVIATRIGQFHKIDRKRCLDFSRFVLQWTAFLVANTIRQIRYQTGNFEVQLNLHLNIIFY